LEGGPVYALSADIGAALSAGRAATIAIDLKPDMDESTIAARLVRRRGKDSFANALRKAIGLGPLGVALLRESDQAAAARNAPDLAALVKACALPVTATAGLERAISAAGGLRREEVDDGLMLKKLPGLFAAGEMLDWDAPTGGYLLQACFATGKRAGAAAAAYATRA
ncbi:MAG: NAD(P)/FAD-dependent oxidoreductase, partial [Rhodoblastus sp.]|nr:NAD(P)/FAD-dependent oxidoreductase [Rhodoblastus sp.]